METAPGAITIHKMTASARFEVYGRVQGVGYRAFVLSVARPLRLQGWVRNRSDGAVEVAALGLEADVERLYRCLQTGPAGAQVMHVERQEWERPAPPGQGFVIMD